MVSRINEKKPPTSTLVGGVRQGGCEANGKYGFVEQDETL